MALVGIIAVVINFLFAARSAMTTGLNWWMLVRHALAALFYVVGGIGAVTCGIIWIVKTVSGH